MGIEKEKTLKNIEKDMKAVVKKLEEVLNLMAQVYRDERSNRSSPGRHPE